MMKGSKTFAVAASALVGAAYAVFTMVLAPISYGPVQFRLSELLCILPFFMPCSVWGLFFGCAIANLLTGNIFDILFGSLATLAAALATARFGRLGNSRLNRILACLMPVLINALVISSVITWAYNGMDIFRHVGVFALNAAQIALGEGAVMFALGLPLMRYLPTRRVFLDVVDKTRYK